MPIAECKIPVTDTALQRGVGCFESIRVYNGRPCALSSHLERLKGSAEGIGIDLSYIKEDIEKVIREGLARDDCPKDALAKPFITGGDINNKGHFPNPRFFVIFDEVHHTSDDAFEKGVALIPNKMDRPNPVVKSLDYLPAIMALAKADPNEYTESLYITPAGEITESMTGNFFLCVGGKVLTAPIGRVLKGVTRTTILTLARENGIEIEERCPMEEELKTATEAFITGSVKEVLPVVKIGDTIIGDGKPGPVAKRLGKLYRENIHRWFE